MFPCLLELWESPRLSKLNSKVVELLIATIKHLYSNEKLVEAKVAEYLKSISPVSSASKTSAAKQSSSSGTNAEASATDGATASAPPTAPPPPPPVHPSVDPLFLQQLCDMGFSRDHAEEALIACANDLTSAMDWILNHPPSSSTPSVSGHRVC